jgi:uncharacterized membrane protein
MLHFKGHPIHTVLVHFPIACYVLSFVADVAAARLPLIEPAVFSFYLLLTGTLTGGLALCTGFFDLVGITDPRAMRTALSHGGLNLVWFCAFGMIFLAEYNIYPELPGASPIVIAVKGICVAGLFVSNYLGGQLILKHKVVSEINKQKHQPNQTSDK